MNTRERTLNRLSRSTSAIIAGAGILIMAIIAPIVNFFILEEMIKSDTLSKNPENILASENQLRLSIVLNLIIVILDIIVAWALFIFLCSINKSLALLAAWFRIVYSILFVVSLFYLIHTLPLIIDGNLEVKYIQSQVALSLNNFFLSWDVAMILFGFHLLLIGYLFLKARYMKKILGVLLLIASIGYIVDGFGQVLSSGYKIKITLYTFIGEVVLIFWLLLKGWKVKSSEQKQETYS
ncbi:DUF4386 domain-containing protein [Tenacibaculum sp.]|uniref:DUF4386 domain-containing protein n=1 Tax=Tenacibaculum sp. TaxID=1906242 RepID=UPI003AA883BB